MRVVVGQTFPVAKLTGIVQSTCPSGAVVGFARVSKSGHTRTFVGDLVVLFPCDGSRRVQMLLAIAPQYHGFEFLEQIRQAVFAAFELPDNGTWTLRVCPECVADYESEPAEGYFELMSDGRA